MNDRDNQRALDAANADPHEGRGAILWGCAMLLLAAGFLVGALLRFILKH